MAMMPTLKPTRLVGDQEYELTHAKIFMTENFSPNLCVSVQLQLSRCRKLLTKYKCMGYFHGIKK